ncbi:MAG TPA: hypothetical protein VMU84_05505 [Thermoanaerobaculia bacterium]|nr:hypothetical protein [Thermoanaerobaculia bacterium]
MQQHTKVKIPTFGRGGLQPGVDLDDSAALLERMEKDRDSRLRERVDRRTKQ